MSEENLFCAVCQKISSLKCAGCRRVVYCSKEHQKLDWKVHKKNCGPGASPTCFKIAEDQKVGRHLVSTRRISKGEIVVEEAPLVTGPPGDTSPVCLGCYKLLNRFNSRNCSRCNWPVCSRDCENSKAHKPECEITAKFKKEKVNITYFEAEHPSYRCITVLRCLYLKSMDRSTWDKINALESHVDQRINSDRYDGDMRLVVKFIPRFFNFHEFSEEDILRMVGIIDVNAHLIPVEESAFIAIYDNGSMIEHSCLPNCSTSFTDDGKIVIRAAREIQEGEHLSISYTYVLWGRQARQIHLFRTKNFVCDCDRCSDPTELGTYFSSFKCPTEGCGGYIAPILKSGLPLEYDWRCADCRGVFSGDDIADLLAIVSEGTSNIHEKNPENCKEYLMKYKKYLHPNHCTMVSVQLELLRCYETKDIVCTSDEDLQYIININQHLIDLASKLTPAENRLRGYLYVCLRTSLSELWRRKCLSGEVDDSQMQQHLLLSRDLLEKGYSFLKTESDVFEEGKMAIEALKNIHFFDKFIGSAQQFY